MKKIMRALVGLSLLLCVQVSAHAYDDKLVHPYLTEGAQSLLISYGGGKYQEITDAYFNVPGSSCDDIREGSILEDNILGAGTFCGVSPLALREHAYNPVTGEGWIGTALSKAATEYQEAVTAFTNRDKGRAYFQLGRVAHLLEDMASPAHVHADWHISGDDYETWTAINYASFTAGTQISQPAGMTLTDFFNELSMQTYRAASFQGVLNMSTESPVDPQSELGRMFPAAGQILFIPADETSSAYWTIDSIGSYGLGMAVTEWWPCKNDAGYYYIENANGDSDTGVIPQEMRTDLLNRYSGMAGNSQTIMTRWASQLFPVAGNYTAGLMKYFYDTMCGDSPQISHSPYPPATTSVNAGETLFFTIEETNSGLCDVSYTAQEYITTPNGATFWHGPVTVKIKAGETKSSQHNIPTSTGAAGGVYTWGAVLTDEAGNRIDADSFAFTVVAAAAKPQVASSIKPRRKAVRR